MANIKFPFGNADKKALTATGLQAITITDQLTIIDGVTTKSTAHRTLNLTIGEDVEAGAIIMLVTKDTNAKNMVFGTNITMETYTATTNNDVASIAFMYNGTAFFPMGGIALAVDES